MIIDCGEIGVAGFYTFELNGKPVFEVPSKNLITDFGWSRLSNLTDIVLSGAECSVGTGNTPPATSNTALGALVAAVVGGSTAVVGNATDGVGNYSFSRTSFVFAQGAVVGNIAEVGFRVASGDASLTSRSLVKDGLGNPAVIVVTVIDQLTVTYELRYYRFNSDITSSVSVAGVPTTYIVRPASPVPGTSADTTRLGGFLPTTLDQLRHFGTGTTFGGLNIDVTGTSVLVSGVTVTGASVTVNPTNTIVAFNSSIIATGSGNSTGGILNLQFSPSGPASRRLGAYGFLKVNFSPIIPKDSTKTIQYSFSYTFTRL